MPVNLILGDQLFADIGDLPAGPIVMVEDDALARHARYHSHKLVLTFAAMRHFAALHGDRVRYSTLDQGRGLFDGLESAMPSGDRTVHTYEPADSFFTSQLEAWAQTNHVKLVQHRNPMFLTSRPEWESYATTHKRRLMADFYRLQRERLGILIDPDGTPTGGRWSFDTENRKRLPRNHVPPSVVPPAITDITGEVVAMVSDHFPQAAGAPHDFAYPVTHQQAEEWLDDFVENRLDLFGDYEDALSYHERTLYHSVLTPALNIGLLTPGGVLQRVMRRHSERPVPLNSLEGFVRQVVGWREFVRGVSREPRTGQDVFQNKRTLTSAWREAKTGLPPLDRSLERARRHGWCHHIERLMVIGSAMFMCEVHPDEVYRYFMQMFVDAADWVMGPNVYGMSQYAGTDSFATKPYFSGSAYLLRMSDEPPGLWCDVWDGLYWRTIDRHKAFFARNQRMSQAVHGLARLDVARKEKIFTTAEAFIQSATSAP